MSGCEGCAHVRILCKKAGDASYCCTRDDTTAYELSDADVLEGCWDYTLQTAVVAADGDSGGSLEQDTNKTA